MHSWLRGAIGLLVILSVHDVTADNADYLRRTFNERVKYANEVCGTSFTGTTSAPTNACDHLFWHIRHLCESGPTKPNPAVRQWLETNVKSVSCSAGPDKISLSGGTLAVTLDDKKSDYYGLLDNAFSDSKDKQKEGKTLKELTGLHLAKRLHEVEQGFLKGAKVLNEGCKTTIALSADVPSWQAGGFLTGYYQDLDVPDVGYQYVFKLSNMCADKKTQDLMAKKVSRIVIRYVGTVDDQSWQSKDKVDFKIAKGVLTFTVASATPGPTVLGRIEKELPDALAAAPNK